ncbi:hypothetical protein MASR2M64_14590 [Candidatus Cloacimonadota bacterium]
MKILCLVLLIIPCFMFAAILQVAADGTQTYLLIQAAVNAAAEQDTILIHPGEYLENIEIDGRELTIASLEFATGDSTYIAQTVVNGNQTGSCFKITANANVTLRGLYLTNGSGTITPSWQSNDGGAIYANNSYVSVVNCRIIGNKARAGSGLCLVYSSGCLAGTTIAHNWGKNAGAVTVTGEDATLAFDPVNRCSVYLNYGSIGNDFMFTIADNANPQIYLDKFTVPYSPDYIAEFIFAQQYNYGVIIPYSLYYNTPVVIPQYADFYVSPYGNDNNSGLTPDAPLKTIALALIKIKADSLHQHTIHLANGEYGEEQNFPLNLRSYVSIEGESEAGTIFSGPDVFFVGWDSEKEVAIRNINFQAITNNATYQYELIQCISRNKYNGVLDKLSLTLENLTFRNCRPTAYTKKYKLISITHPEKLVMNNITIADCMGTNAIGVFGGNFYANNISIHHFYPPPTGERGGGALALSVNHPVFTGGDNYISNLQITGCVNNMVDWSLSTNLSIIGAYGTNAIENYFINATIADNICTSGFGAAVTIALDGRATFINSIISNNYPYNFRICNENLPSRLRFLNSLIGPGETPWDTINNLSPSNTIEWYGSNIDASPNFHVASADNPFGLSDTSPCIDSGTTDLSMFNLPDWYQFPMYDLARNARIYGTQIDMGAYEWQGITSNDDLVTPQLTDLIYATNYPNPFNPVTTISFFLPHSGKTELVIYNQKGQKVRTLCSTSLPQGTHKLIWNGSSESGTPVASGIYLYRISTSHGSITRKMILAK